MKRWIPVFVAALALCSIPATAQKPYYFLGGNVGLTGFFNDDSDMFLSPALMGGMTYDPTLRRPYVRASGGLLFIPGFGLYGLDITMGMAFPIIKGLYAAALVEVWSGSNVVIGKAAVGYDFAGFLIEFGVPLVVFAEGSETGPGWNITVGFREREF